MEQQICDCNNALRIVLSLLTDQIGLTAIRQLDCQFQNVHESGSEDSHGTLKDRCFRFYFIIILKII